LGRKNKNGGEKKKDEPPPHNSEKGRSIIDNREQ